MEGVLSPGVPRLPMAGEGKPPLSKLQRRAPASLQIDPEAVPISRETVFSCVPIPLLSPLVLTPPAEHQHEAEKKPGNEEGPAGRGSGAERGEVGRGSTAALLAGWQHPAVPAAAESSSLHSLFQAQCMLASHAQ